MSLKSAQRNLKAAKERFTNEAIKAIQETVSFIILNTPHITTYYQANGTFIFNVEGTYIYGDGEESSRADLSDGMNEWEKESVELSDEVWAKFNELSDFFEENHDEHLLGIPMKIQRRPDLPNKTEIMTDW
jgi:hypothetical protein